MSEIVTYVRDNMRRPLGTIIGRREEGTNNVIIGFALCNPKKKHKSEDLADSGDIVQCQKGKEISRKRAEAWKDYTRVVIIGGKESHTSVHKSSKQCFRKYLSLIKEKVIEENKISAAPLTIPDSNVVCVDASLSQKLKKFIYRCSVFFKGCDIPPWAKTFSSMNI